MKALLYLYESITFLSKQSKITCVFWVDLSEFSWSHRHIKVLKTNTMVSYKTINLHVFQETPSFSGSLYINSCGLLSTPLSSGGRMRSDLSLGSLIPQSWPDSGVFRRAGVTWHMRSFPELSATITRWISLSKSPTAGWHTGTHSLDLVN